MRALIAGTLKYFPNGQFKLGNVTYSTQSLVALFQSVIDAIVAADAAKASAKDAVAAMRGVKKNVAPVALDYKRFILATFRTATQALAEFDIEIKSPKPKTSEELVAAAEKARATRKARGTTSKKEKLAVKGNVTGVIVTPVTSNPSAPQPASTVSSAPGASK